ncbi:MAG: hypothetical protein AAFY72_07720 [Cyanobacteria bacterium J06649_4]
MAIAYWTVAALTFATILSAFLRDRQASKTNPKAWVFIAVATLLWPITLPFIISSKLRMAKAKRQTNQKQPQQSRHSDTDGQVMTTMHTAPAGES